MNTQLIRPQIIPCAEQRGAVLVVALVLLTVLTFIAVTALNSSSMEEKMAGNTQEHYRAFQSTEASFDVAIQDKSTISLKEVNPGSLLTCPAGVVSELIRSSIGSYLVDISVCTNLLIIQAGPRGSGFGSSNNNFAYYEMNGVATTNSQSEVNLNGGIIMKLAQ